MTEGFVFGGYRVVRERRAESYFGKDVPEWFVSASDCLGRPLPDWACHHSHAQDTAFEQGERRAELGLDDDDCQRLCDVVAALGAKDEIAWRTCHVMSSAGIREIYDVAMHGADRLRLVGLALRGDLLDELLAAEPSADFKTGSIVEVMRSRVVVPTNGQALGFEPRCMVDWDPGCSWHCNALGRELTQRTGVKPNVNGLIDDHAAALAFCRVITREGLAEPGLWLPWLVVDYTPAFSR